MWALDLLGIREALEGIQVQLKRLADIAEKESGFLAPTTKPEEAGSGSSVFYMNDAEAARLEAARMAYEVRTGQRLGASEPPPSPMGPDGTEWQ